jgi:hypothetical protein
MGAHLVSDETADWLRDQMGMPGVRMKPRRIVHRGGGGGGGVSDIVPCVTTNNVTNIEGISVELYKNGFLERRTGSGKLYLPEVATHTFLPSNTSILAHVCKATYTQSDESEDAQDNPEEQT